MGINTITPRRRRWAIGNVSTGMEFAVAKKLRKGGLELYCPYFKKPVRVRYWGRKKKRETIDKAAFPGYLFVNYETVSNLESVERETPDFHYFLRNKGRVSLLHDDQIDALRALEGKGILVATSIRELVSQFFKGDLVRVEEGAMEGYTGIVEKQQGERVVVSERDFSMPVELPAEILSLEDG